jgi:hypothetical protein
MSNSSRKPSRALQEILKGPDSMPADRQLALIEDDATVEASEKARGVFNGSLLQKSNPEKYKQIVDMLAHGVSYRDIAKLTRTSRNLIRVIAASGEIDPHRQRVAGKLRVVAELSAERMVEILEDDEKMQDVSLRDLSIALGVAADKSQVLSGGATSIVQVDVSDPGRGEYERMLAGHQVIDVTDQTTSRQTGLLVEDGGTNSEAPAADPGAGLASAGDQEAASESGREDIVSPVSSEIPQCFEQKAGVVARLVTEPGTESAAAPVQRAGEKTPAAATSEVGGAGVAAPLPPSST